MNYKVKAGILGMCIGAAGLTACSFNPEDNGVVLKYGVIPDSQVESNEGDAVVDDVTDDYEPEIDDTVTTKYGAAIQHEDSYNPFDESMVIKYGVFNGDGSQ